MSSDSCCVVVLNSSQWISEVMHFCAGLPIILVGCKKDLRRDPRVVEELRKTNQRPVTPEEVRVPTYLIALSAHCVRLCRVWRWRRRLVLSTTSNALRRLVKVSAKCSNMPLAQRCFLAPRGRRSTTAAWSSRLYRLGLHVALYCTAERNCSTSCRPPLSRSNTPSSLPMTCSSWLRIANDSHYHALGAVALPDSACESHILDILYTFILRLATFVSVSVSHASFHL